MSENDKQWKQACSLVEAEMKAQLDEKKKEKAPAPSTPFQSGPARAAGYGPKGFAGYPRGYSQQFHNPYIPHGQSFYGSFRPPLNYGPVGYPTSYVRGHITPFFFLLCCIRSLPNTPRFLSKLSFMQRKRDFL